MTTYKAEQIKFALQRLRLAVNTSADRLDISQLGTDAMIVGASRKAVAAILKDGDAPTMPMRGPGHCPTEDEIRRAADTQGGTNS